MSNKSLKKIIIKDMILLQKSFLPLDKSNNVTIQIYQNYKNRHI